MCISCAYNMCYNPRLRFAEIGGGSSLGAGSVFANVCLI